MATHDSAQSTYPRLAGARAQVKVEATLEPLLDIVIVAGDETQAAVLLGQEVALPVLRVRILPLLNLLGRREVLFRRVVRLEDRIKDMSDLAPSRRYGPEKGSCI